MGTAADVDAGEIKHPVSGGFRLGPFWCRRLQLLSALSQAGLLGPIGEEAVVADSHEARGQNVLQEAVNEFFGRKGERLLPVSVGAISVAERHLRLIAGEQTVIGDGHTMRVTSQIVQQFLGTGECPTRFSVTWRYLTVVFRLLWPIKI